MNPAGFARAGLPLVFAVGEQRSRRMARCDVPVFDHRGRLVSLWKRELIGLASPQPMLSQAPPNPA